MIHEESRLAFVRTRDGAAKPFARQVLFQYRKALAERNSRGFRSGYGLAYRRTLVESCIDFRSYLRGDLP